MKKIWVANIIEEDGKYYSFAESIDCGNNLLCSLARHKGLTVSHLCESKAKAFELVEIWNHGYKTNGCYLFDNPNF